MAESTESRRRKSTDQPSSLDGSTQPKKKVKENSFSWTDSEIQLLLETVKEFKTKQEYKGIDWNSVRTRFDEIRDRFVNLYPTNGDEEEYPHGNEIEVFTKERVLLKLKAIRLGFKKALDSGRVSGGGRVVACYYDLCSQIWGGSPAVEKMAYGVETSGINDYLGGDEASEATGSEETSSNLSENVDLVNTTTTNANGLQGGEASVSRRQLLSDKLKDYRGSKLKKKLPMESQLVTIAKEDMELKRNIVDQLKVGDQEHSEYVKNLGNTMNQMTHCISSGFQLLTNIFHQHQSMMNMQSQHLAPVQPFLPFNNNYQQQAPGFAQQTPGFAQQAPGFGQHAQQAPGFGQQAPSFGQQAPSFGQLADEQSPQDIQTLQN